MAFFDIFKKEKKYKPENLIGKEAEAKVVYSPLKGEMLALEKVSDSAFSQKVIGDGIAIIPTEGKLYSPINGTVIALFETKHAMGIMSDDGIEILIHIGIDTVEMQGRGFKALVQKGDHVVLGQLLIEFDINQIEEAGYEATTMVLVPNYRDLGTMKIENSTKLDLMDKIISF